MLRALRPLQSIRRRIRHIVAGWVQKDIALRSWTLTAACYVTELARRVPAAIFSPVPRSIRSMLDCRIVDYARTTARLKEAISWPVKPGPMRDG